MSNEPKWHCGTEDEHAYVQSIEGTFYALSIVSATNICDTLNRLEADLYHNEVIRNSLDTLLSSEVEHRRKLESENAELRERLDNALKGHDLLREAGNRLAKKLREAQSTTPRTDADGLKTPPQILAELFNQPHTQDWYAPVLEAMARYANQFRKEGEQNG